MMYRQNVTVPTHAQQHQFVDFLLETLNLKNDAALARFLEVAPPIISKMRRGYTSVSAGIILLVHEKTGLPVALLRSVIVPDPTPEPLAA